MQIDYQIMSLKENYQPIFSNNNREHWKRINGLGSIMNAISENLDEEDGKCYEYALEIRENKEYEIEISLNHMIFGKSNRPFSLVVHKQNIPRRNTYN